MTNMMKQVGRLSKTPLISRLKAQLSYLHFIQKILQYFTSIVNDLVTTYRSNYKFSLKHAFSTLIELFKA